METREKLKSRLGFILLSAGCAIGIGNVWRFPYMTGQNGGGFFVLIYVICLVALGVPIMTMEYAIGRASGKSILPALRKLEPKGTKWHIFGYFAIVGNYVLLMFYSIVSAWILYYFVLMVKGTFVGATTEQIGDTFGNMMGTPGIMLTYMVITMVLTVLICSSGLEAGVERITKVMMISLLAIMIVLGIWAMTLPGAGEGIRFYLQPSLTNAREVGIGKVIYSALNQSFFTLSLGMGSMMIFGSYISKEHSLAGESILVVILDTVVALTAGLIIFPACFAFDIAPDSGTGLIFLTLPRVFAEIPGGRLWGSLFFLFLYFAAMSTMVGVFENDISFSMDLFGWTRKQASAFSGIIITLGSVPCALGFNVWSAFQPLKEGNCIMDLEDFYVSNLVLPFGALLFCLFCTSRYGWGFDNYIEEVNAGKGLKITPKLKFYFKYILPVIVCFLAVYGVVSYF